MSGKRRISGAGSSFIAAWATIIVLLVLSVVALRYSLTGLGAFLALLGVLGLVSRLWSMRAVKGLHVSVSADSSALEQGQKAVFTYRVENRKPLPVMWLEFCAKAEAAPCMEPDEGFARGSFEDIDAEKYGFRDFFRKRLVFLMSFQSIAWKTPWTAVRRGVFVQDSYFLRTGDGFGLAESCCIVKTSGEPLAVWPEIKPVSLRPFLRQAWLGSAGKRGQVEDITVLDSLRDYQNGDSWKRIDWRAAARQDELKIKVFQKVTPERIHFILDCASFSARSPQAAEDALSLLASLLFAIDGAGIPCGVTLPADGAPQRDIFPENGGTLEAILYELAAYSPENAAGSFETEPLQQAAGDAGQIWIISSGGGSPACRGLLELFEKSGAKLLSDLPCQDDALPCLSFADILEAAT